MSSVPVFFNNLDNPAKDRVSGRVVSLPEQWVNQYLFQITAALYGRKEGRDSKPPAAGMRLAGLPGHIDSLIERFCYHADTVPFKLFYVNYPLKQALQRVS